MAQAPSEKMRICPTIVEKATAVWRSWELISEESVDLLESRNLHINSNFKSIAAGKMKAAM
jgi:hypothetical protein